MTPTYIEADLRIENQYPKLVRDNIPALVESQGKKAAIKVLVDDKEYLDFLLAKLIEEASELAEAKTKDNQIEELADVFEVIESLLEFKDISRDDIALRQEQKRQKRGSFKDRLLMLSRPQG